MLVLGRKENESIIIGDNIRVTVVGRSGSCIRLGVQAPSDVRIVREELTRDPHQASQAFTGGQPKDADTSSDPGEETDQDDAPPAMPRRNVIVAELPAFVMPPRAAG